ncbi:DUF4214 domain-containing protein [Hominifimenecus sp. rT4P-3]|uniref:DUF4214 domain-containing protein n=1 Tax=Hominifimenecus sp. rT4P-3 TaxID=3242979 RepID=UPI003DA54D89
MRSVALKMCAILCAGSMLLGSGSALASPVPESSSIPESAQTEEREIPEFTGMETTLESSSGEETIPELPEQEETLSEDNVEPEETLGGEPEESVPTEPETPSLEEPVVAEALPLEAKSDQQTYYEAFVARLYEYCLGRTARADEIAAWVACLQNNQNTGIEVAYGFIFSEEYQNKKTGDEAYVQMLYRTFFGREADSSGLASWVNCLYNGSSRRKVFEGFANSDEYRTICSRYQVVRGHYVSNEIEDQNPAVTSFVMRLYRTCLGRQAETKGLQAWVSALLSGQNTGADIAWGFLNSDEMQNKRLSNADFLDVLYRALMNREADASGKSGWLAVYEKGVSNRAVVQGFVGSQEFRNLCNAYGIKVGNLDLTEARDLYPEISGFAIKFYRVCMNRVPTGRELNGWVQGLKEKSISSLDIAYGFFFSEEYQRKNKNNTDFVADVYRALLGREPDKSGSADWVRVLNRGVSRETVVTQMADSQEYINACRSRGIARFKNGWQTGGQKVYYIKNDSRVSGWQTIDGNRYYFDPNDGNARVTGWEYVDGLKYFFYGDGKLCTDLDDIIGKQSSYRIEVNRQCNTVTVYAKDGGNGYTIPVKSFICSTGASGATPTGTFSTPNKYRWHELMNKVYGQWCTRIVGGVLFHSVYYHDYTNGTLYTGAYNQLGRSVSHGCVRLTAGDAKWIYDNCSLGTQVTIYDSSVAGPYGKPSAYQLPSWHTWDPTDPTAYDRCGQRGCH